MAAERTADQGNADQGAANQGSSKQRTVFLAALEQGYSVTFARKKAGLDRAALKAWRADDDGFAEDWDVAVEAGTDLLEDLARERVATGGDSLLMFLLKSRRPEKYRERHDHQVDAGIASGVLIVPASIDLETWVDQAERQTAKATARLAADQGQPYVDGPALPTRAVEATETADGAKRAP